MCLRTKKIRESRNGMQCIKLSSFKGRTDITSQTDLGGFPYTSTGTSQLGVGHSKLNTFKRRYKRIKSQAERLVHARTMDGGTLLLFLVKIQVKVTKRKRSITEVHTRPGKCEAYDGAERVRARDSRSKDNK